MFIIVFTDRIMTVTIWWNSKFIMLLIGIIDRDNTLSITSNKTNVVILLQVDVKGCYWPVSEVVNLQVFPHFSPSEATIAVMRNCTYSRKVMTYKLPICRFNLQYLCRRAILHLVSFRDVHKLPLPANIVNFLLAKPGYTHIGVSDRRHPCWWSLCVSVVIIGHFHLTVFFVVFIVLFSLKDFFSWIFFYFNQWIFFFNKIL